MKMLNKILKAIAALPDPNMAVTTGLVSFAESYKKSHNELFEAIGNIKIEPDPRIGELKEGMNDIGEALEALIGAEELDHQLKEIENAQHISE